MSCTTICAAGAIAAAALAGTPGGTGDNYCHLTWDKQCCPVPGCDVSIAPGILTICNEKPDPAEFQWELIDVSGMGLQFMPQNGVVAPGGMNPAGQTGPCFEIPFTVICPDPFPVGSVADYQAIVTKVGTNETFTCFGNVVNRVPLKLDPPGDPVIDVVIADPGVPAPSTPVGISAHNIGSSGKDGVRIHFEVMGPFVVNPPAADLPPIPPDSSWTVDSFFDIAYEIEPFPAPRGPTSTTVMGDVLYKIDTTGDGQGDTVIGSQTVRAAPAGPDCPTDINGDGVTDTADLGILIGAFGTMCP